MGPEQLAVGNAGGFSVAVGRQDHRAASPEQLVMGPGRAGKQVPVPSPKQWGRAQPCGAGLVPVGWWM